jgi:hypothetical protein
LACDIAVDVKLRNLVVLVLLLLAVGFSLIAYLARTDRRGPGPIAVTSVSISHSAPTQDAASSPLANRQKREELRRKILEAWTTTTNPEIAADAKRGRFVERPNADGWGIDPAYVQSTMREEMFPMVRSCYEDLLTRQPDAGGRVQLWFKIVADDTLGGIVEEDEDSDAGLVSGWTGDEKMQTCIHQSLLTVTFPPPAHHGIVTVGYPFVVSPGDDDDDAGQH